MYRKSEETYMHANHGVASSWAKKFMVAAIIQGAIIAGLTIFLVLGQASLIKPEVSRVIAGGGAGTWFTFGLIMYIVVGVIGVAVSSLFYDYLEKILAASVRRIGKVMAWTHLILMNLGTAAAMGMLMLAGYQGGAAMLPEAVGGKGFNAAQAHEILAPFVEPISAAILVLVVGIIAGGVGFLLTFKSSLQPKSPTGANLSE
jgi:hypothetical protein